MDWITRIQRAIDYVEAHIMEPIEYEEVAKCAYSSSFHFQRIFSILCGFTLGEYIRSRRLSMAGNELSESNEKIIDVALKYGYDSPESFSRAFTRFHGVLPSQVKANGVSLKSFSPLFVKLILDGGNIMDYRIENKNSFDIIVKKKHVSCNKELSSTEISDFWCQCGMDGTIDTVCKYIPKDNIFGDCIVGVCFGNDATEQEFPYGIGAMYNGEPIKDDNYVVEKIPAHTYVVFPFKNIVTESFPNLYKQIYTEFFPTSEYEPCGGTDFEVYPPSVVNSTVYNCEIWMAVVKK